MGRLSVAPRPYQFVPLIMALRMDPVRLLIADDVGVGKTIEASMIARELLDRGVINRVGSPLCATPMRAVGGRTSHQVQYRRCHYPVIKNRALRARPPPERHLPIPVLPPSRCQHRLCEVGAESADVLGQRSRLHHRRRGSYCGTSQRRPVGDPTPALRPNPRIGKHDDSRHIDIDHRPLLTVG